MPPAKAAYVLVVDGFADWEPAHAVAELRRTGGYRIEVVGLTTAPVRSMGGLTVTPSKPLTDLDLADVAVFILPGGDRWESAPLEPELESTLKRPDRATDRDEAIVVLGPRAQADRVAGAARCGQPAASVPKTAPQAIRSASAPFRHRRSKDL